MRVLLLLLVACGGGSSGSAGTFDATLTIDGSSTTFLASCELRTSDGITRGFADAGDDHSFELIWRDTVVETGSYEVGGLAGDEIVVYLQDPALSTIQSLSGSLAFSALGTSRAEGMFALVGDDDGISIEASGLFSCE